MWSIMVNVIILKCYVLENLIKKKSQHEELNHLEDENTDKLHILSGLIFHFKDFLILAPCDSLPE